MRRGAVSRIAVGATLHSIRFWLHCFEAYWQLQQRHAVAGQQAETKCVSCACCCWCLQDLFYITILAALMGYTKPRKELARAKPVGRVLSLPLILSLLLQIAVVIVFQVGRL